MTDSIERVRDFARGSDSLSESQLNSARQRLLKEIAVEERRRRSPRWWALPSLVAGAAAVVIAVAVLVPLRAPSAAAQVFHDAGALSVIAADIEVPTGQYLEVETTSNLLVLWDVDMPATWARFNNGDPRAAEAGLELHATSKLYVPSDRDDDWTLVNSDARIVTEYGERADEARADWIRDNPEQAGETIVYPGGEIQSPEGGTPSYLDRRDLYPTMPRDSELLLQWWRDRSGVSGAEADRWIVRTMAEDLSVNLMPADLRQAMFDALALVAGAEVTTVDGDLTTVSFPWTVGARRFETQLVVDTKRGLIARTTELEYVEGTPFPSPLVTQETSVSMKAADAPASDGQGQQ